MDGKLKKFLNLICVKHGICISPAEQSKICNVDELIKKQCLLKIFDAEGLNPVIHSDLYKKVQSDFELTYKRGDFVGWAVPSK